MKIVIKNKQLIICTIYNYITHDINCNVYNFYIVLFIHKDITGIKLF